MKRDPEPSELEKVLAKLRRAKHNLDVQDEELHVLIQAVSGFYLRVGADATILSSKAAFPSPFEFMSSDPAGRRITDVLPRDVASQILKGIEQVHQQQAAVNINFDRKENDTTYHMEARLFPFSNNQVAILMLRALDAPQPSSWVTLNQRLVFLGQMTAGISHELNNPLSVILGFAQSLLLHPQDEQSVSNSIKSIEREALRCKRLIQDLLTFSRSPKPKKASEDLIGVLQGALSLVEAQARIRRVELMSDCSMNLPRVYVDRHRIQQLVVNLCINAIDAMPQGGTLTVGVKLLSDSKDTSQVELFVKDTGVGIPQNIKEKMFDPFFTTKDPEKGTGLGLSLVRDIVKEHQGSIQVFTEAGKGTTFVVLLPIGQSEQMPGRSPLVETSEAQPSVPPD